MGGKSSRPLNGCTEFSGLSPWQVSVIRGGLRFFQPGSTSGDNRLLCGEVHLNLAYRWFCDLGLNGKWLFQQLSNTLWHLV
jgi:hypothetical protein